MHVGWDDMVMRVCFQVTTAKFDCLLVAINARIHPASHSVVWHAHARAWACPILKVDPFFRSLQSDVTRTQNGFLLRLLRGDTLLHSRITVTKHDVSTHFFFLLFPQHSRLSPPCLASGDTLAHMLCQKRVDDSIAPVYYFMRVCRRHMISLVADPLCLRAFFFALAPLTRSVHRSVLAPCSNLLTSSCSMPPLPQVNKAVHWRHAVRGG